MAETRNLKGTTEIEFQIGTGGKLVAGYPNTLSAPDRVIDIRADVVSEILRDQPTDYFFWEPVTGSTATNRVRPKIPMRLRGPTNGGAIQTLGPSLVEGPGTSWISSATAGWYARATNGDNINLLPVRLDLTLECWVAVLALPGVDKLAIGVGGITAGGALEGGIGLTLQAGGTWVPTATTTGGPVIAGGVAIKVGHIHHLVVTLEGTDFRFYCDGRLISASTLAASVEQGYDRVSLAWDDGASPDAATPGVQALWQHVAVYDSILSPARIWEHYLAGSGPYAARILQDSALSYYYRCQEIREAEYAKDETGHGWDAHRPAGALAFWISLGNREGVRGLRPNRAYAASNDASAGALLEYLHGAPPPVSLTRGNTYTVLGWTFMGSDNRIYGEDAPPDTSIGLFAYGAADRSKGIYIGQHSGAWTFEILDNAGSPVYVTQLPGTAAPGMNRPDAQWHFIAASYDGAVLRMYVDGKVVAQNAVVLTSWDESSNLALEILGTDPTHVTDYGGAMEVAAFRRVLSDAEIRAYHDLGRSTFFTTAPTEVRARTLTVAGVDLPVNPQGGLEVHAQRASSFTSYKEMVLGTPGVVAYWPMDGDNPWRYANEVNPSIELFLPTMPPVVRVPGLVAGGGPAHYLDGTDYFQTAIDYPTAIRRSNPDPFLFAPNYGGYTFEYWVCQTRDVAGGAGYPAHVSLRFNAVTDFSFSILGPLAGTSDGCLTVQWSTGGATVTLVSPALINLGQTYHVALVFRYLGGGAGRTCELYVDGTLVAGQVTASNFIAVDPSGYVYLLGRSAGPETQMFGIFQHAAVYQRALLPMEIRQHYRMGLGRHANTLIDYGPAGFWRLQRRSQTQANAAGSYEKNMMEPGCPSASMKTGYFTNLAATSNFGIAAVHPDGDPVPGSMRDATGSPFVIPPNAAWVPRNANGSLLISFWVDIPEHDPAMAGGESLFVLDDANWQANLIPNLNEDDSGLGGIFWTVGGVQVGGRAIRRGPNHIALYGQGKSAQVWINGVKTGETGTGGNYGSFAGHNLWIGADGFSAARGCVISDFAIFVDRIFSPEEIRSLYLSGWDGMHSGLPDARAGFEVRHGGLTTLRAGPAGVALQGSLGLRCRTLPTTGTVHEINPADGIILMRTTGKKMILPYPEEFNLGPGQSCMIWFSNHPGPCSTTVYAPSGRTIDGAASVAITGDFKTIVSDGIDYFTL